MKRGLAIALILAAAVPPALAKGDKDEGDDEEEKASSKDSDDEESSSDEDEDEDEEADEDEEDDKADAASKDDEDEEETDEDGLPEKQNLTGRDEGTDKTITTFEKNRFFVDKVDTKATENGTLIQGSIASSSFFYGETGGKYPMDTIGNAGNAGENTGFKRLFTELRLQTDFRHIKASRWEARVDVRGRFVPQPANDVAVGGSILQTQPNRIQSGLLGENELDVRELWLIRSGVRTDVFIGRQFVPDLGAVKFDGLRVDYAKSAKLTLIGFGGLYPIRGSRSITTDYPELKDASGNPAGRLVTTGGFGAAYRTPTAYGALGGVIMYPLQKEQPRVYVTANGYLRSGPKLDVFHYLLLDVLGRAAQESQYKVQLTNFSAGANFKPNQRLRLTAAFHRVDTDTLNVHAGAYLNDPDTSMVGTTIVQSDTYIARIATNTARGGISAGLGKGQRFEVSTAVSYRFRPDFTLRPPSNMAVNVDLPGASSVEVWASFVDRHSIKGARIGVDGAQSFQVGKQAYQRSVMFTGRLFVLREFMDGRGEWEAEVNYSDIRDSVLNKTMVACTIPPQVQDCYGTSNNKLYQLGGQLFYRLKEDWFGIGTLHFLRSTNLRSDKVSDPAIIGVTGFVRIAKRF